MKNNKPIVHIDTLFYLYMSCMLLSMPLQWVLSFVLCSSLHEISHILAAKAMHVQIRKIKVGIGGAQIYTAPMQIWQEALCAAAGPVGGLLPAFFLHIFPEAAFWALVLTVYNVMPIFPSDGARVLRCILLSIFLPKTAESIVKIIECVFITGIILIGIYGTIFLRLGIVPIGLTILLAVNGKFKKQLANTDDCR